MPALWRGIYGAQTYAYDGVGNRSSLVAGSTTSSYTYASNANQIIAIANTVAPPSTGTGSYLYNASHQRVQKVAGGSTTQFVYDQAGHLVAEADGSGAVQREYIWLDDMPVAMVDSTGTSPVLYFIHTDQLGTPQKITDGSLNVVWDGVADPFGNPATGASLALTSLRFPGQYFDDESGLNQNWNRDYDPTTGRYIQGDPIGLGGGSNTYVYVNSMPVTEYDADGLEAASYILHHLPPLPPPHEVSSRAKQEICKWINNCAGDMQCVFNHLSDARNHKNSQGRSDPKTWNDPILRQAENFAAAAAPNSVTSYPDSAGAHNALGVLIYQFILKPFKRSTTPISYDAYNAGMAGLALYGRSPSDVIKWCGHAESNNCGKAQ